MTLCCIDIYVCVLEITQPEFIIHITEASRVILPVAEKLKFTTLASEENLDRERQYEMDNVRFIDHKTFLKTPRMDRLILRFPKKKSKRLVKNILVIFLTMYEFMKTEYTQRFSRIMMKIVQLSVKSLY